MSLVDSYLLTLRTNGDSARLGLDRYCKHKHKVTWGFS